MGITFSNVIDSSTTFRSILGPTIDDTLLSCLTVQQPTVRYGAHSFILGKCTKIYNFRLVDETAAHYNVEIHSVEKTEDESAKESRHSVDSEVIVTNPNNH